MNIVDYKKRQNYVISACSNAIKFIASFMEQVYDASYTGDSKEIERQLLNVKESVDLLVIGYEQNFKGLKPRRGRSHG